MKPLVQLFIVLFFITLLGVQLGKAQSPEDQTVVFVTGGDEYQSRERMEPFAEKLEEDYSFNVIYIKDEAPGADEDENKDPDPTPLPKADQIKKADLMVVFMRFRNWTNRSTKLFMEHFKSGKPALGIRTTTHAFWEDRTFSPEYFGGHYKTHYNDRIVAQVNPEHADHPMVRGVQRKWGQGEGPYVSTPLTEGAIPVVFSYGHNRDREESPGIGNDSYDSPNYPVAWAYYHNGARRPMITLGSYRVGDLKADYFQNLFFNSVFWALEYEVPENGVLAEGNDFEAVPEKQEYRLKEANIPAPPDFNPADKEEWEMLFDGGDLSKWRHYDVTVPPYMLYVDRRANSEGPIDYTMAPARWNIENEMLVARPGYGDIITRHHFNNYKLRLDYYIPEYPEWVTGEWRGNSGVYLNGSWEIAILDSYGKQPTDRSNGAIYRRKAPLTNASKPADQWQTLEVTFIDGKATVELNGTVIHKSVKLYKPTFMGFPTATIWPDESFPSYDETVTEGPIRLQAENSKVRFANIAIQRLD